MVISLKLLFLSLAKLPNAVYLVAIFLLINGMPANLCYFYAANLAEKGSGVKKFFTRSSNSFFALIDLFVSVMYCNYILRSDAFQISGIVVIVVSAIISMIRIMLLFRKEEVMTNVLLNLYFKVRRNFSERKQEGIDKLFLIWEDYFSEKHSILEETDFGEEFDQLSPERKVERIEEDEKEKLEKLEKLKEIYTRKYEEIKKEYSDVFNR